MGGKTAAPPRPSTPAALVAASARAGESARAKRRARWMRAIVGVLLAASIGAAVWAACFSSLLAVRDVRVTGLVQLSEEQVLGVAAVPTGGSLVLLDSDSIANRIRSLPAVADVEVNRRPLHSVRLVVRERVPVLILESNVGRQSVDSTGTVFGPADDRGAGLPLIRTTGPALPRETLRAVLDVLAALPTPVRGDVAVVRADNVADVSVELRDGRLILWGDADRGALKAQVLSVLMGRAGRAYDVSTPEAPAIVK
ncbi:MAG: cell division protein FtsQ/DivIB [Sporichthyaceae bacterium]